nr:hypothetical protein [Actinomyces sp. 2119]
MHRLVGDEPASVNEKDALSKVIELGEVVGGQQHGASMSCEIDDDGVNPAYPEGVQAVGWLIKDQ